MLWPVYEFRPLPRHIGETLLRFADGQWIADDGEYDIAFVSYGLGPAFGLGIDLPYQKNIIWSGLTGHWTARDHDHPRNNPWHYMLRDGETEWGGAWHERDVHPNMLARRKAMDHCCAINRCANGRGPRFEIGDPYIAAGLVRVRDTREVVTFPERPQCMYCGDAWSAKAAALEAAQ